MGRWLEKARKRPDDVPTKLTEPGFVGFVSTPPGRFQETEPVELAAASEITTPSSPLADGGVIQRCDEQGTVNAEGDERLQYGDDLLAVVTMPGFERQLSEEEIGKVLAGTDAALVADTTGTSPAWINRPQRIEETVEAYVEEEVEPQRTVRTAATSSPDWLTVRDQFYHHLMTCRACHAPADRYCNTGSDLRQRYDNTPMETSE